MTDPFVDEDYDVLKNSPAGRERRVLDKGFVRLVDCMPRLVPASRKTADFAVVQAARVSTGAGLKSPEEDVKTHRFLVRSTHTTPSEMVEFKFHCHMPLFVARQWIRHRTANVNEKSGRYSAMSDTFHRPQTLRRQSSANKQGSGGPLDDATAADFLDGLDAVQADAYARYEAAVAGGMTLEQARMILPVNVYCVHADTPILAADLRWVRAGDLRSGDPLVGFEEYPGRGRGSGRRLMPSTVTDFAIREGDLYRIILSNGEELVCNGEHRWLGCYASSSKRAWLQTSQIARTPGRFNLLKTFNVWKEAASYDAGYLAAAIDGEGYLTRTGGNGRSMGFVQKDNAMLTKVKAILMREGIRFTESELVSGVRSLNMLGGFSQILEMIGRFRPVRIMDKWTSNIGGGLFPLETPTVIAVEPIGRGPIASFATTSKTYFANGYPCHNTEWFWKIDLHNLLHFLGLRCDAHAQEEIRVYADAMLELITPIVPEAIRAWNDYHPMRDAVLLTRLEADAIRRSLKHASVVGLLPSEASDREQNAWVDKAKKLGLIVAT